MVWAAGLDSTYRAAYALPHHLSARVEIWTPNPADSYLTFTKLTDLPYSTGEVRATLASRVTRQLALTVTTEWFPWADTDPLAPLGNQLRVWRGIRYGDGTRVDFPVFVGRISTVELADDRSVRITCFDPAKDVIDNEFEAPTNSSTATIAQQVTELISNAYPPAQFGTFDTINNPVPTISWDTDRGQALDDLATAGGAFWYCLSDGSFVLRKVPWAQDPADVTADITLSQGEGGTITHAAVSRTRDQLANSITGLAERTDGSAPLHATVRDLDPASATYWFGKFGRINRTYQIQAAASYGQLQSAARVQLQRAKSRVINYAVSCVPDASIELGDAVEINAFGRSVVQCVAGYSLPLTTNGDMQLQLRAFTPGVV